MSHKSSSSYKVWKDEIQRLQSKNVLITTSGGRFVGSLTLTSDKDIVRLAPNASGLLPVTIAVSKIENITDLSGLSLAEYNAFVATSDAVNSTF